MRDVLLVAIGGAFGSTGRYLIDRAVGHTSYPVATLTVNLVGSFLLGFLVGWAGDRVAPGLRLALFTGLLGGFTTFSTFALESSTLLRSSNTASGISYIVLSIGVGVALAALGLVAGESLAG